MAGPRVMLVDDETSFVETTARRLEKRGIEVRKASSGEEGLELLKAEPDLDVMILDIKMPGMDGIATLKKLKADFPLVEVVLLTGNATIDTAVDGLRAGAFDYLTKPCTIEDLIEKVDKAAQKKRAHDAKVHDWERYMTGFTLKELMVPIEDYATVSEDANIFQAINALEEAQNTFDPKRYRHRAVLVLDPDRRVIGKLNQHDIIQALEPNYKKLEQEGQEGLKRFGLSEFFVKTAMHEFRLWEKPIANLFQKATRQLVRDVMYTPDKEEFIEIGAEMDEAVHKLIVGRHQSLLVTEGGSIVGILRLTDVFDLIHLRLKTMQIAQKIGYKTEGGGGGEAASGPPQ